MKDINNDAFRKLGELQISEREEWRINKGRSDFIDINETDSNTIALYRSHIAFKLAPIAKVEPELIFNALDIPIKYENGDLTLPVPKLRLKGDPKQLAAEWKKEFDSNLVTMNVQEVFLRFYFNKEFLLPQVINQILSMGDSYGKNDLGKGKTLCVDFSSVNIAKPFHAGHLRSTIIGAFLCNLYEFCGWKTVRINYLGDWGKQFGLLAVGYQKHGNEDLLKEDPIQNMFEIYVRICAEAEQEEEASKLSAENKSGDKDENIVSWNRVSIHDQARAYFKRMEEGDEEALSLWRKFRDYSIENLKKTYARLNIKFDYYAGESFISYKDMMDQLERLKNLGYLTEDEGAKIIDFSGIDPKLGKVVLQKKDGSTLYLTRDIVEAIRRRDEYHFDKSIYVVASQQSLHFQQLFKIMELLGYDWCKDLQHLHYGLVQGMSTRKGKVIFLKDMLDVAQEKMHSVMQKNEAKYAQIENPEYVADQIGRTGIFIQDMSAKRMLSFEGDTGPYLQYAHSRLSSVFRNSDISQEELLFADIKLLKEPQAVNLARILAQFPEIIKQSYRSQEASTIVTYLFKVAHMISGLYDILWVRGQERELAKARLALFQAAKQVVGNGMKVLNLIPLERM